MKKTLTFLAILVIVGSGYWFFKNQKEGKTMNTLIPRSVLFGNPEKTMVRLSPNGEHLAHLANLDGVLNIFVTKADKPLGSKPITKDNGRGIRQYFWLYDNQHIAYVKDDGGDENERIHIVNITTAEDKTFTPEKVKALIYCVSDKFPDEIIIGLNDRNQSYHDVYRLNIKTGEKTLVLQNDSEFSDFIFDDDYNLRFAVIATKDGGHEYFKVSINGKKEYEWESYLKIGSEDVYTTHLLGLTREGNILYMLDSRETDLNVLKEINLETKEEKILAKAEKAEISGTLNHPQTGVVEAFSTNYLRKEWTCLDKEIESHLSNIRKTLKGELNIVSRTLDDSLWIIADMRDDGPIGFYIYCKPEKKLTFLFNHREDLNKYKLSKMEGVVIKSRDGLSLPSYITKPVDAKGPVPLVLVVHGGPVARDEWGYKPEVQWLANRGYAVLQVNYRASTGFGKAFISMGNCEWGRKMHEDLLDAVKWAIKEGIADASKISIYGGSYGGYAALWGATHSGDVFKCSVDIVGPSNLQTLLDTVPPYWASYQEMLYRRIGDPRTNEGKELLIERSPLSHVDKIKIPVLIAHGEKDPRVKQAESEQIVAAMKAKNLPYIYMLFMDEGHGFARPENKFAFYGVAERFLADNLGGRFEELTNELDKTTLFPEHKNDLVERFVK
ncbi:MAG: S9 family peptidase [Proteobacteria bacterium]|nr:S9 family peptidase [Pseudomonadota bacterium]